MEKVLCIKRENIPSKWLYEQSSIKIEEELFFSMLLGSDINKIENFNYYWIDRSMAEKDREFKQIIPYIIIQSNNGEFTAVYRRKGSESRLHGLWSIGIGGHINLKDDVNNPDKFDINKLDRPKLDNFRQILYSGMKREFNEEICLKKEKNFIPKFIGVINEDLTDVGKVHFGIVFKADVNFKDDLIAKEELVDFQWVNTDKLLVGKLSISNLDNVKIELWSQLSLQLL